VGNIESHSRNVLYAYLEVQNIETPLTNKRVDVGAWVPIKFKVVLAHDKKPLDSGRIFVGEFEATLLGDGWSGRLTKIQACVTMGHISTASLCLKYCKFKHRYRSNSPPIATIVGNVPEGEILHITHIKNKYS